MNKAMTSTRIFLLTLAYFSMGWLGLQVSYGESHITLIWLPTGIAVAALLRWGKSVWPGIYLGAFLVNLSIGPSIPLAAGIAVGNTLAPLVTCYLLKKIGFQPAIERLKDVRLLIAAACAGMLLSATGGVANLYLAGLLPLQATGTACLSWWMGDVVGVLLGAPLLLTLSWKNIQQPAKHRKELLIWLLVACPVGWLAFIHDYDLPGRSLPLAFLTLPLFAWAALRFGNSGAAFAGLGFSVVAAWGTTTGHGTFFVATPQISLFLLWSYMAITVLTGLLITALQAERLAIEQNLRIAATAFEAQVGIIVTDANGVIMKVNRAFTEASGFTPEDAIGQTPRILKSGLHDSAFYTAMWESIQRTGTWQGEIWDRRKNGETYPKWMTITEVKSQDGATTHFVSTQFDITARKAAEEEIKFLAFYDPLTGLPNRRLLFDRLRLALASSIRSQRHGALLFLDLDNFKSINDTLGHDKGDLLLKQVAQSITDCVREADTVARLGGDEFVVMLEDLSSTTTEAATQAKACGEKILAMLNRTYMLSGHECHNTTSIGITLFSEKHEALDQLLKQADLAMYQAKLAGRNALRFFDPDMQTVVTARVALEKDLRIAIREEQFLLYYQAQVDGDGNIVGAEALVRWLHPARGLILPNNFISLAEDTGLILPLGHWVLESACRQLVAWENLIDAAHLTLAVNVSMQELRQPDFVEQVLAVLVRTGVDPCKVKLEITESQLMDKVEDTIAKMTALKSHGVNFALDDFGTGYSSLAYLKRLPLEKLKIDRSFVSDVLTDPNDAVIAKTIVVLAQQLGLEVIAEGVETEEQRHFLAQNGCHAYQGYLFSRPLPLGDFEQLLMATRRERAVVAD